MIKSILVVCEGNICRSPVAEALLAKALEGRDVQVGSAGIRALVGHGMAKTAQEVLLRENGIDFTTHKARQADAEMLRKADLILTMEEFHARSVESIAPEVRGKVLLIGKWLSNQEVPDPYRLSKEMFQNVQILLTRCVDSWLPYIK